jgi:hypothetical protein
MIELVPPLGVDFIFFWNLYFENLIKSQQHIDLISDFDATFLIFYVQSLYSVCSLCYNNIDLIYWAFYLFFS